MCWNVKYILLILFTTIISYITGICVESVKELKKKRIVLSCAVVGCLGVLFFFKYYNFFFESLIKVFGVFAIQVNPILLKLMLPVGISFYTFQTLSYVIDVYKGDIKAERHFGYYAAFISFFPQLVAGPIERTRNLLPQIKADHQFDYIQASYGLKLMAWGYFKKIVIADTLSQFVSKVYDYPQNWKGFSIVLATIFFTIQIYCDFSGYSDIAIGTAKLLGINLMTNFKCPYFSQSIKEFWGRWHISLSSWFKDYIYIPLGGSYVGKIRWIYNILITFLVSGLWHGANWTFVIWGGVHGLGQVIERMIIPIDLLKTRSRGVIGILRGMFVFAFVSFAWIFFVSNSLSDAMYVLTHMFDGITHPMHYLRVGLATMGIKKAIFLKECLLIFILMIYDYYSLSMDVISSISEKKTIIRWVIYILFGLIIVFFSQKGVETEFVYFQF